MRFSTRFLTPILIMVVSTVGALIAGLLWMTDIQNEMAGQRERLLVESAFRARLDVLRRLGEDYAVWDEAARRLGLTMDHAWADENIATAFDQYGIEASLVVEPPGQALYAFVDGKHGNPTPAEWLGEGYRAAAASQFTAKALDAPTVAGVTQSNKGLFLFAISRIRPLSASVRLPGTVRRYLVMAKRIDAGVIKDVSNAARVNTLTLRRTPDAAESSAPIKTFDGVAVASFQWRAEKPGTLLRDRVAMWLVILVLLISALASAVLMSAHYALRELCGNEAKASHLAHHDWLTALPNRRALMKRLVQLDRQRRAYFLVYLDLDGFKEVNDGFGHSTGDALLREIADNLRAVAAGDYFLARFGGDEFGLIIEGDLSHDAANDICDRLGAAVRQPHQLGGDAISVGASIGVASGHAIAPEEVLRRADVAMYAAKAQGRDRGVMYDPSLDVGRFERMSLEASLREALAAQEIRVVFQPIVHARTAKIESVEALARWTHPVKGEISPDIFIPIAEESGLIGELSRQVLRQACTAARDWPCNLAINLSTAQFWDKAVVSGLLEVIAECDFPAVRLEFEITETYLLRNPETSAAIIADLRRNGIRIALDDFGTGYASIGYLRNFQLDLLKIDRSLSQHIASDREAADVVCAIISLAKALRLPVIAEGVETERQAVLLAVAGCSFLQGWHYGRPMSPEVIEKRLLGMKEMAA